jgi:hypothetical protein
MSNKDLALEWLFGGDTGVSSKALCAHMLGIEVKGALGVMAPSDAADRGRCIRLLNKIPAWWDRLDEMAETEPQKDVLVISASGINKEQNGWAKQIPLIRSEAGHE